ncbi:MAG: phospholipase D-like domain-containing protein [Pseudomonadota bacterium]|nr:phospholipase D-like domain-containing protein [Pseudomonadota bacterium]
MHLITSGHNEPFNQIQKLLNESTNEILIISPYIKLKSLEKLDLPNNNVKISIITTLRLADILSGVSDIDLFSYAKSNKYKLFINNTVHLKAYISDWENMIFGSANLTSKGIGYNRNYNYELNGFVEHVGYQTIYYLRKILSESSLMDESLYEFMKAECADYEQNYSIKEPDISKYLAREKNAFLISSLPMSYDIDKLYSYLKGDLHSDDTEFINCAVHDQLLYDLPLSTDYDSFIETLKTNFFKSKFIVALLGFIDEKDRYFGEVKAWIQNNCTDVPLPSKRDLTGNIQVLYKWIEYLSDGIYKIDRPNHSERIRREKDEH